MKTVLKKMLISVVSLLIFVFSLRNISAQQKANEIENLKNTSKKTTAVDISKYLESKSDFPTKQVDIVFSLPIEANSETIDVVIVLDKSFNDADMRKELSRLIDDMSTFENAKINVGIIEFDLDARDLLSGLVALNVDSIDVIKNAIQKGSNAGTNMHGALIKTKVVLDSSNSKNSNKYVILASDFARNKSDPGDGHGRVQFMHINNNYF